MDNFTQLEKYLYLYRLYQKDDLTPGKEKEYVLGFVNLLIENKIIATLEERKTKEGETKYLAFFGIFDRHYECNFFRYADIVSEKKNSQNKETYAYAFISRYSLERKYQGSKVKNAAIIIDNLLNFDIAKYIDKNIDLEITNNSHKVPYIVEGFKLIDEYQKYKEEAYQNLTNKEFIDYQVKSINETLGRFGYSLDNYKEFKEVPLGCSPSLLFALNNSSYYFLNEACERLKDYFDFRELKEGEELKNIVDENDISSLINGLINKNNLVFAEKISEIVAHFKVISEIQSMVNVDRLVSLLPGELVYQALKKIYDNNDGYSMIDVTRNTINIFNQVNDPLLFNSPFDVSSFEKVLIENDDYNFSSILTSHFSKLVFHFNGYDKVLIDKMIFDIDSYYKKGYYFSIYIDNSFHYNFNDKSNKNLKRFETYLSTINIPLNVIGGMKENYTLDEYIKADRKMDKIIKKINNFNYSPLEKVFAILQIVGEAKYKVGDDEDKPYESRDLISIINSDVRVCSGFANLFNYLCQEAGIISFTQNLDISRPTDTEEDRKYSYHANNIVFIKDDKYDVEGLYYFDSTWDSGGKKSFTMMFYSFLPLQDVQQLKCNITIHGSTALFYEKLYGKEVRDIFLTSDANVENEMNSTQLLYGIKLYHPYVKCIEKYSAFFHQNYEELIPLLDELYLMMEEKEISITAFKNIDTYPLSLLLAYLFLGNRREVNHLLKEIKKNTKIKNNSLDALTFLIFEDDEKIFKEKIFENLERESTHDYLATCIANIIYVRKMKSYIKKHHLDIIGKPIPLDTLKNASDVVFKNMYPDYPSLAENYINYHLKHAKEIYDKKAINSLYKN